ncbi:uncharacterized protein CC84DRAFT_1160277 [Paraphaeosphaeria sporulosa]|uniref:Uncharacterized protein n=1 Tax=Paraphaeosphaeria sporulosa TaxID=1460663 RepID=A0A177D1D2_9PLEO|nr:uncharacterized protein CC84DRAFT_1160277 [Paraphaeosphaeria sporulosa]OAG13037.1 hypothetical protein CC84DRAFT_1160277 [Paraphaeosphaeria sporulosa]
MEPHYGVAIIGLGAMGASTHYQLSNRGVRACGIDRFSPPKSKAPATAHPASRASSLAKAPPTSRYSSSAACSS